MKFSSSQTSIEPAKSHGLENAKRSASEFELKVLLDDSNDSGALPSTLCDAETPEALGETPDTVSSHNPQSIAPLASPEQSLESLPEAVSSEADVRRGESKTSNQYVRTLDIRTSQSNAQTAAQTAGRQRVQSITSTESVLFCRICHQGELDEALIQMCHCSGTMGLVHKSCIEKWLGTVGSDKCEICGFGFNTERVTKPFSEWLLGQANMKDRHNLVADLSCFVVLTPLAGVSTWLCVTGAQHYYSVQANRYNWETWGLTALTVFLITIYLIWCGVAFRYHRRVYHTWRHRNQFVRVLDSSIHKENLSDTTILEIDDNNNNMISVPSSPPPQSPSVGTARSIDTVYVCERCAKTTRPRTPDA